MTGQGNRHWYVAYVKAYKEKIIAKEVEALGVECYLPIQKCRRKWSDRIKIVEKLVLPRMLFVRETEHGRVCLLESLPDRMHFINENGPYTPCVIPDRQMEIFMQMVSGEEGTVEFSEEIPQPGDMVRIKRGPLAGHECELIRVKGKNCIAARLGILGTATLEISLSNLEKA